MPIIVQRSENSISEATRQKAHRDRDLVGSGFAVAGLRSGYAHSHTPTHIQTRAFSTDEVAGRPF